MLRFAVLTLISTLLLTIPVQAAVLVDADFDDGTAGPFIPNDPGWEVTGGQYRCVTEGFEILSMTGAGTGDLTWDDYFVGWDVMAHGGTNHILLFRNVDYNTYYSLNMRAAPWNDLRFERVVNGVATDLKIIEYVSQVDSWYRIEVSAIGYGFTVQINGDQVMSCADETAPPQLRGGGVALVSYSGGVVRYQEIFYDNVWVQTTNVPTEAVTWGGVKALFE